MKSRIKSAGILLSLAFIISCDEDSGHQIPQPPDEIDLTNSFYYEINLRDRSDDTFKVRMFVDDLTSDNGIFQFPATTPGTYDIHDIGRFVMNFRAYSENHHELEVSRISTNQWKLMDPENTRIIEFEVKETFDTPVTAYPIYTMAGTSMENDHTLLNAFDVLGYPTGLKERDFYLHVDYPSNWTVGTSLQKDPNGNYFAADFDKLVDSPLMFGFITSANSTVAGSGINIYTYSKNNLIQASQIMSDVSYILDDASAFLKGLPVDRYSFIYFFDQQPASSGALEHSYSSVYVLADQPYSAGYGLFLRNISAHEFFHVVTPLNIHSEIIEDFNFADPTPSEHLWLYEGVTEWASHMMQFRNNHIDMVTLLSRFGSKKSTADFFNTNNGGPMSLSQMSLTCYNEGGLQFGNVYNKGALVAALLDIRLLELSGGTKGLREIILQLIETYGPENAFSEENFFDDLAVLTGYPTEVADFLNKYVKGTDPLPMTEYFNKLGIAFNESNNTFSVNENPTGAQLVLRNKWSVNF
ncbi:MAG TPA: peptidase [Cyclobacteriaceae bacterium]|nr:peptidase [Cyclobacteriaceae bacterium]